MYSVLNHLSIVLEDINLVLISYSTTLHNVMQLVTKAVMPEYYYLLLYGLVGLSVCHFCIKKKEKQPIISGIYNFLTCV